MRVTSKGQVTIPQAIRERLGLLPYSEVEFDIVGDSVRIARVLVAAVTSSSRRSQTHDTQGDRQSQIES